MATVSSPQRRTNIDPATPTVGARDWARKISNLFWDVATAEQRQLAVNILDARPGRGAPERIAPPGPSLDELASRLAGTDRRVLAPAAEAPTIAAPPAAKNRARWVLWLGEAPYVVRVLPTPDGGVQVRLKGAGETVYLTRRAGKLACDCGSAEPCRHATALTAVLGGLLTPPYVPPRPMTPYARRPRPVEPAPFGDGIFPADGPDANDDEPVERWGPDTVVGLGPNAAPIIPMRRGRA